MVKELNFQEQAFMALYLESFNATQAALGASYSENVAKNHAWSWVSITGCPLNKIHLRDAIQAEVDRRFQSERVDSEWVLRRAKLIADFSLGKFLRMTDGGDAVYDFSEATEDDWYCVEQYTTEQSYRKAAGGEPVPVDKLKIKVPSKVAALKLVGDHVNVQAFKQQIEHSGAVACELTRTIVDVED